MAIIRNWKSGDDEAIFELFDRTARWLSNESYTTKFDDKGLTPEGIVLAEEDGLIVGHVMGTRTEIMCEGRPTIFGGIGQVMVDENYRGLGIGKAILQKIIQYHTEGRCRGILLWTQDNRIPAYPIYEKFGFRIAARRAFYRFRISESKSPLSVEPYTEKFTEQTEAIRQEWMRSSFPVGIKSMRPSSTNWHVILKDRQPVGYVNIGKQDDIPFLSRAVALLSSASDVCETLLAHLRKLGHEEAIWQTCVGSVWEEELHKRGFRDGELETDVRMCLSIGSPVNIDNQRPEFDGCSTW